MITGRVTHVLYLSDVDGRHPFSGAEAHVFTLLRALAREGVDVELVAILWAGSTYERVFERLKGLSEAGVGIVVIRRKAWFGRLGHYLSLLRGWRDAWLVLRRRRQRVIHLHLDHVFMPLVAWLAGCRRVVFSVHSDEPAYRKRLARLWLRCLNGMICRYIAITEHVRCHFQAVSCVDERKIVTVRYGVDEPERRFSRADAAIPEQAYVVGYVGRLAEQKNLATFIRAIARSTDVIGVLIGDGPLRVELEALTRAMQATNIRFLGAKPDAADWMPMFDVLCLPSHHEGLGLVLVEAMLQRVPVMGSRRGAIPEVLNQGSCGLLFEPDVDGLVAAVASACTHRDEMAQRATRAYEWARRTFSLNAMVARTREVYRDAEEQGC